MLPTRPGLAQGLAFEGGANYLTRIEGGGFHLRLVASHKPTWAWTFGYLATFDIKKPSEDGVGRRERLSTFHVTGRRPFNLGESWELAPMIGLQFARRRVTLVDLNNQVEEKTSHLGPLLGLNLKWKPGAIQPYVEAEWLVHDYSHGAFLVGIQVWLKKTAQQP